MAAKKELLNAIKVIKKHCEEHNKDMKGKALDCKTCMLRNATNGCGLFVINSHTETYVDSPLEWNIIDPDVPKLFTY